MSKSLRDVISEAVGGKGMYAGPVAMSFAHQTEGRDDTIYHHLGVYPNEEAAHREIHKYFTGGNPDDPRANEWLEDDDYKNADARGRTKIHVGAEKEMGGDFQYKICRI